MVELIKICEKNWVDKIPRSLLEEQEALFRQSHVCFAARQGAISCNGSRLVKAYKQIGLRCLSTPQFYGGTYRIATIQVLELTESVLGIKVEEPVKEASTSACPAAWY